MNPTTIHYLNLFLGGGAIILQILSIFTLAVLFFGTKRNQFLDYVDKHFITIGFLITLAASVFPLVYSEIIGFLPCTLCWWQRVFMIPNLFLFGVALWDRDKKVVRFAAPLVSIGFIISLYQNFFYYFGAGSSLPCDASGVSCYQRLVSEFGGYISIPMLALTAFFALLTLLAVAHFYPRNKNDD